MHQGRRSPRAACRRSRASRARRRPSTSSPTRSCLSTASSRRCLQMLAARVAGAPRLHGALFVRDRPLLVAVRDRPVRGAPGDGPGGRDDLGIGARGRDRRGRAPARAADARRHGRHAMTRVLVTERAGPAGVAVIRLPQRRGDAEVYAADMDRWASAIYLVPPERRRLVPADVRPSSSTSRALASRRRHRRALPDRRRRACRGSPPPATTWRRRHAAARVTTLATIETCLDASRSPGACARTVRAPLTGFVGTPEATSGWDFRLVVKPRRGAGSRGVRTVFTAAEPRRRARRGGPARAGDAPRRRVLVDVLAGPDGRVIAAVPRARLGASTPASRSRADRARRRFRRRRVRGRPRGRSDERRERAPQAGRRRHARAPRGQPRFPARCR